MNIGIVTTWFERGAAYVSLIYEELLASTGNNVFIFARGGENHPSKKSSKWNKSNVTRSDKYADTRIDKRLFFQWIKNNKIEALLFNEQQDFSILIDCKKKFPGIKTCAYVDYYTERTLPYFDFYDFLICNTHRHMLAMEKHPQKFYVPWGTNIDVYKPSADEHHEKLTFFHSVGMSSRKGTDILLKAFIDGKCYEKSKLIVHTQIPIESVSSYSADDLSKYDIDVVTKTVPAPGLYFLGDVYVYPTRLDGLGLTMYEALASGLPILTTDFPPMNEVGDSTCARYIQVKDFYCRGDAYYYPMAICDENSLIENINWFIDNKELIPKLKQDARKFAVNNYNILDRAEQVSRLFQQASIRPLNKELASAYERYKFVEFMPIEQIRHLRVVDNFAIARKQKIGK